jgi:hypothetical protein
MEITVYYFDKDENEKEIEVEVEVSAYFDGIGPYEFWGSKGYDKGNLCVDIEETTYDKTGLTEDEIKQIEQEIASEKFASKVYEKYLDDQQSAREAAAEAAYDASKEDFNY